MKTKISRRDWQRLSAYVDGKLTVRERSSLEQRLQADVALRSALADLRTLRTALGSLPSVPAPRNFTLTPEMVGRRAEDSLPRRYPVLRLASVVSSLLFVIVLLVDFVGLGTGGLAATRLPAPAALPQEAVPMESLEQDVALEEQKALDAPDSEAEAAEVPREEAAGAPADAMDDGLQATQLPAVAESPQSSLVTQRVALLVVEILLGVVAVATTVAMFYLRSRSS